MLCVIFQIVLQGLQCYLSTFDHLLSRILKNKLSIWMARVKGESKLKEGKFYIEREVHGTARNGQDGLKDKLGEAERLPHMLKSHVEEHGLNSGDNGDPF